MEIAGFDFNKLSPEDYRKLVDAAIVLGTSVAALIAMFSKLGNMGEKVDEKMREVAEIISKGMGGTNRLF